MTTKNTDDDEEHGNENQDVEVEVIMPPTIGAVMVSSPSEPTPVSHRSGFWLRI
jgi:hypothetical protein